MDEFNMVNFLDEVKENLGYIFSDEVIYKIDSDLIARFCIEIQQFPYNVSVPLSDISKDISEINSYEDGQIKYPLIVTSYSSRIANAAIIAALKRFRQE